MKAISNAGKSLAISSYIHDSKSRFDACFAEFFASVHLVLTFRGLARTPPDSKVMAVPRASAAHSINVVGGLLTCHYVQPCPESDLNTSHPDATLLSDTYILSFGDNDVPWSITNNGPSRQHDGDVECDLIRNTGHRNDFLVDESAFTSSLSSGSSSTVHHTATTYDHGTTNFAAFDWVGGFSEQPGSYEAMLPPDCADSIYNLPLSMVDGSSCSDHWHTNLQVDVVGAPHGAFARDTVEPYLLQCQDGLSIEDDELDTTRTLDISSHNSLPELLSSAAVNVRPQGLGKRSLTRKGEHRQCNTSVFREWLHINGLRSYPSPDQIAELAAIAGVTVKQARNALSNFRSRMQQKLGENELRQCHTTITPKRKGRRRHVSRFDKSHQTVIPSPSHASSRSGLDATRAYHCTACPKSFETAYS
ncbi:hypothetical protein HBH56_041920 [Parastagonospora nodorum]|uniref:Homeobox domain-containing protein n=1 Tax=Phaeosphaeria nodorum (strain SN15 / ATCC MYA-4574 / FGSC 10173) TaxID=321614 RepID=A0A7U2EUB2_PHANO|nr:hypothetical protein HBH56_041920 [Parastagonospora nodorum]QRC92972.1 hypothetical protein JI435_079850 [Parastagonospora nodorum SN15]KAH3933064.1 hypothetical protein HBH54_069670 [Parastagonospora nodorum]KAH3943525.1 hypothetical protein HBH53_173840 [Parastagonospora nodorum]KAH4003973.1 hypothetical protein HBI10_048710 [Parastagonospora nodorum]